MVVISELTSIFWGVALEGSNKKYSQTTERPVHITMAALDPFQTHDENPVSLMIERDGRSFVLCTLQHGKHFQQPLDLEFASGEELIFFLKGKGVIHLSGYVMPEDEFPGLSDVMTDSDKEDEEEEEELESDEDVSSPGRQSKKRQKSDKETKKSSKKAKMTIEDIDEDDDDDDSDAEFIDDEAEEASEDDDEEEYEDDDDDDLEKELLHEDSDAESSDSDEEMDMKKAVTVDKKPNIGKKGKKTDASGEADVKSKPAAQTGAEKVNVPVLTTPATQPLSAAASDTSQVAEGKKKKKKKKKKNKNAAQQQQTAGGSTAVGPAAAKPSKRTVEGGIVVEDVKEGHGPEAIRKTGSCLLHWPSRKWQNIRLHNDGKWV